MDVKSIAGVEITSSSIEVKSKATQNGKSAQVEVKIAKLDLQIDLKTDTYQHETPIKKVTYEKPTIKPDMKALDQLMEESDKAFAHLKQIVTDMLKRQGLKFRDIIEINVAEVEGKPIDETAQKEAQAMIAEGGEYSPENVSQRIVEFAKAISGGDKSKLDQLKAAIEDGFKAAEKDFGDKLPDITKETYKLIMDKLDAWVHEDNQEVEQSGPTANPLEKIG